MAAADCTLDLAPGAAAVRPKTRVRASELLAWPRLGVELPVSPDGAWSFGRDVRQLASARAYVYVADDPLNATDPSGDVAAAAACVIIEIPFIGEISCAVGVVVTAGALIGGALALSQVPSDANAEPVPQPGPNPQSVAAGETSSSAADDETDQEDCSAEQYYRRQDVARRQANAEFQRVVKEFGLNKRRQRMLHDEITRQGYGADEIEQIAESMFGSRGPQ